MPKFVIHKHYASRLHFDLRLEMGGVLKSWAVPKEPSADTKVRRLAIQVDDHPLDYAGFEGQIAEGQYGAGRVEIWDSGQYELLERQEGFMRVRFAGQRLDGPWKLIKTRFAPGSWLFAASRGASMRPV